MAKRKKIQMEKGRNENILETFGVYRNARKGRELSKKTIKTYTQHFQSLQLPFPLPGGDSYTASVSPRRLTEKGKHGIIFTKLGFSFGPTLYHISLGVDTVSHSVFFCNYSVGPEVYKEVPAICAPFGKRILLLGGRRALEAGRGRLESALEGSGLELADVQIYGTDCTMTNIHKWASHAKAVGADMIFGMGGGRALDTAKGAASEAGLPLFTFPTIAATCAGMTKLSVIYWENGSLDHFAYAARPPRHCFINLEVLAQAPAEYLQAGMGDTIGKFFECHFSARNDRLEHSSALGREISNMCYEPLREHGSQALMDCKANLVSNSLEQAALAIIVSTGLVSTLVLDLYNGAVAHSTYYGMVTIPGFDETHRHGNVVSYGVLVQLMLDGDREKALEVKTFLQSIGIDTTCREMKVPLDRETLAPTLTAIVNAPDMKHIPYQVDEDMIFHAMELVEGL